MSFLNPFAIGFVCVAAGFVVGADYVVQSKANGSNPGEYAFTSYLESYGIRLDGTVASIEKTRRQAEGARTHLPEAPAGWVRTEWGIDAEHVNAVLAGMGIVERMAAKTEKSKSFKLAKEHAWEYTNGEETIRISAQFQDDVGLPETATAGWLTGTFHPIFAAQYRPFTVVEGLPFLSVTDAEDEGAVTHFLLEAHLGTQITIAVAADAKPETVESLIQKIDITSLNLMLDEPLENVGVDAPAYGSEEERALASFYAKSLNERTQVTMAMLRAPLTADDAAEDSVASIQAETEAAAESVQRIKSQGGQAFGNTSNRIQLSGGRSCVGGTGLLCD